MTSAEWTAADITLNPGIIGVEEDTGRTKIGDGRRSWNRLPYDGGYITHILSEDTGYTLGANIDITHPTGWVYADIEAIGSGGAGASGSCRGDGVMSRGGSGGGPGGYTKRRIFANEVAQTFFRCVVPSGGVGGASVSTDADGNTGTAGSSAFVYDGSSGNIIVQGVYGVGATVSTPGGSFGSELNTSSGGGTSSATGLVGGGGFSATIGGAGAGGGITTGNVWSGGGQSARTMASPIGSSPVQTNINGGATEGAEGSGLDTLTFNVGRSGSGGASSTIGNGGAGGNGGKYGAGGGGGGAARLGVGASGKGGDGAPGIIKITYAL